MAARSGEGQRAAPAAGRLWRPRWSGLRSACAGRRALLGPEEEEEEGEGGEALRCPAPLGFSLLPSLPPSPASLLRGAPRAAPKMAAAPPAPRAVTKRRERTNGAGGGRGRAHVRAGEGREEPRRALRQRGRSCGAAGGDGLFAQLRGRPVVRSRAEHGWTRRAPLQQELKPRWSHLNAVSALLAAKKGKKEKKKAEVSLTPASKGSRGAQNNLQGPTATPVQTAAAPPEPSALREALQAQSCQGTGPQVVYGIICKCYQKNSTE